MFFCLFLCKYKSEPDWFGQVHVLCDAKGPAYKKEERHHEWGPLW